MTIYATVFLVLVGLAGGYVIALFAIMRWPGRFSVLRKLVALANGLTNLDSREVVFQDELFGCGRASLVMLARQLNAHSLEDALEEGRDALDLMSMLDIVTFINRNGMVSHGYEFKDVNELDTFLTQNSGTKTLLLLESYETAPSLAYALMKPFYTVLRIFGMDSAFGSGVRHWVLLCDIGEMRVVVMDPLLGKVRMARKRFEKLWSGYGMVVCAPLHRVN